MEHAIFDVGLALALMAATAVLATRIRFSVAPFLILAGMAVGPHAPRWGILDFSFIESGPLIDLLGRLGVLFLLFYLGLEFSVGRLLKAGRKIAIGGTIYLSINYTLSLLFGFLTGWPVREALVIAGVMTITSTAIVAKTLVDLKRTANPETEMILGMIMFDDFFLAVYMSLLSGLILTGATSFGEVVRSGGIALGFVLGVLLFGRKLVPLLNRALNIASNETFLLVLFAALFLTAGFGATIHVAEAIGALLVGLVLAETEHRERIEHLILPFRDLFGAVFFFSFGLSIDPRTLGGAVLPALGAVVLTIVGNFLTGLLVGRTTGFSPQASANIGLTITARGEFSIVLANLGRAGGLLPSLQPFAALYVISLAILGPILTRESRRIWKFVSRFLPGFQDRGPGGRSPAEARV